MPGPYFSFLCFKTKTDLVSEIKFDEGIANNVYKNTYLIKYT